MTGQMKFALASAAAVVCFLGATMPSQALNCQRGSFTTPRCFQALEKQIGQAEGIEGCLKQMEAEYGGTNGSAGAGRNFDADKRKCSRLMADLSRGVSLDEASGNEAELNSAIKAVKSWAGQ